MTWAPHGTLHLLNFASAGAPITIPEGEGVDIGFPLNWPFYTGDLVTPDAGVTGLVGLFGRPYLIKVEDYRRTFQDAYRSAQDTSNLPGEQTLNVEGVWIRYGTDWRFGAGQRRFDGPEANRSRFEASIGVDPWTEGQISLQHDTEVLWDDPAEVVRLLVGPAGELVVVQAGAVTVISGGVDTAVTGLGGRSIQDATADSNRVWLATDDGIYSFTFGGLAASSFTGGDTDTWSSIILANGRLIGGKANGLYEISDSGTVSAAIYEHTSIAFEWTVLAEHPSWVYAGGSVGSRFEVFRIGVDDTGALGPVVQAMPLLGSEAVNRILYYQGHLVLATSRGFRFCDVDNNGNIAFGAVVEQPGEVRDLYADGDFIYFTWDQLEPGLSGIGRIVPARFGFTEGNVPAWASDLSFTSSGDVTAVAVHDGQVVFAVEGEGVITGNENYRESGWFETGLMDFDIPYTVQPLSVQLRSLDLDSGESIVVEWATVETAYDVLGTHIGAGSRESTKMPFSGIRTDGIKLRITLNRTDASFTPTLTQWILQASPQPQRMEVITLPIIMHSTVLPSETGPPRYQDVREEYRRLANLVRSGIVVTYQEGPHAYRVKVLNVEVQPVRWTSDPVPFSFFEHLLVTQLQVVDDA